MRRGIFILACVASVTACQAQIIYVDGDAAGLNNGSSWENACNYLQDALADANASAKPLEVRVAQGIYRPDQGAGIVPGSRVATFRLINEVAIRGGYAGSGELDPNERDIERYVTILSGDLAGNDVDVNDASELFGEPSRAENAYHVVTGGGTDETAVLDGFTVIGGNANGAQNVHDKGGGAYIDAGSPTVVDCRFHENSAYTAGGVYSRYGTVTLIDCVFSSNSAGVGGGMGNTYSGPTLSGCEFAENWALSGGGMHNADDSNVDLIDCTFSRNEAQMNGAAVHNDSSTATFTDCRFVDNAAPSGAAMYNMEGSDVTLSNCLFTGNSARLYGAGIENWMGCSLKLVNCIFSGNSAELIGGATYNYGGNQVTVTNCTFAANWAGKGMAFACDSRRQQQPGTVEIINSILWDGAGEIWNNDASAIAVTYSDVRGGWPGQGNIVADPCFADAGRWADTDDPNITVEPNDPNAVWIEGDYHLKSQAGRWEPSENSKFEIPNSKLLNGSWVKDDVTSPCIDAGDPASAVADEPAPHGDRINMGAYGGTSQASKSPSCFYAGPADCCGRVITQAAVDTWVSLGRPDCWCDPCHCRGDANGSCTINAVDVLALRAAWPGFGGTYNPCADKNYDGAINAVDVLALRGGWPGFGGPGCSGCPPCP